MTDSKGAAIDKEEAQEWFDALMRFAEDNINAIPMDVLEAIDYVANYCGDIAKGREYTPEKPLDAFPTLLAQEVKRVIGEDDDFVGDRDYQSIRNQLRAEQRRKAGLV